jgi:hypothetical protein
VGGSPGFLNETINVFKCVVNGTPCKWHSLSYTHAKEQARMHKLISWSQVVMLSISPDYANLELHWFTTWDPNDSLLRAQAYVIPVPIAKKRLTIKVWGQQFQAKVHAVELGFAITFYKIQVKTLPLLILNLYKRGCAPEINLMALLVGLFRVHKSRNVRLLPPCCNSPRWVPTIKHTATSSH